MIILGIETSCDETAAAVIQIKKEEKIEVLANIVSSQIEIHKKYGGVVPEVAAREHILNILPIINEALAKAKITRKKISAIAVTTGPGLITSLIVGVETAKTIAYTWDIPVIPVNHIEGHIYANFISRPKAEIKFPALVLTVSGGHNMLVLMRGHGKYKIIGETIDDAAGEAFDKAAAMLKLGYPGGPEISKYAKKYILSQKNFLLISPLAKRGERWFLPRPMINSKDYNFSFSGLKTALLYKIKKDFKWKERIPEYAFEFQQAVIDVLIHKTLKAAKEYNIKTIMLTGGVAANKELRRQMEEKIKALIPDASFAVSDLKYTTDNAAMIAAAGYFQLVRKRLVKWQKLKADSNLSFRS
jgi:N6-L-threonylcarbamoyladenine synthase